MKNKMFSGMKSFFKSEAKEPEVKLKMEKAKKLPSGFANSVLDYELLVDSGTCDLETVDALMQLYSVSIYYFKILMVKFVQ
jgi:hypothetical protein